MDKIVRSRRLRANEPLRNLIRETTVTTSDLIYPLFVVEGTNVCTEIPAMPNVFHYSIDRLLLELENIQKAGITGVLLFGVPDTKDEKGSGAYDEDGLIPRALRAAKKRFPNLLLAADVCLCAYTSHGHCGIYKNGKVENDETVSLLSKTALHYAKAGADIIAPSDMMDGRVGAIRQTLDQHNLQDTVIMSYSVKYASSFYGPFREAAHSTPSVGDRKSYQMDYGNKNEAMKEIALDIEEGADIIIIKPALAYLDILHAAKQRFDVPLAAYNVSGEYSMIKAAAQKGWLDEKAAVTESLTAMKRAGADIIITYFAKEFAMWQSRDKEI